MTSESKIAANRNNARKSTGPRTTEGRARASRNAFRHGLASTAPRGIELSARLDRMAKSICGEGAPVAQYEQAVIIAECEIRLRNVRTAMERAFARMSAAAAAGNATRSGSRWRR